MKYFLTTMAALVLVMTSFAQPPQAPQGQGRPDRMPPMIDQFEQKDPALMAQEETDRLDRLVGLSERQYKKIYKFNKRQYKALQRDMENARPQGFPEGMGPGGPGFGGGRPEGMGPGGPGGPRGGQRPEMGQGRPPMMGGSPELMQEFRVKQEKKYRQVLTPEQFQKWESFQAEREFRRMVERP
jgi:hypothetical protein